jgi:hypothetical protein
MGSHKNAHTVQARQLRTLIDRMQDERTVGCMLVRAAAHAIHVHADALFTNTTRERTEGDSIQEA